MASRREYCPIASGVDVLGDRWTPLIIRELMVGASGFNEIHRGIPRVSRNLLAQRLRELERRGLVDHRGRTRAVRGLRADPAGQALTPIVWAMGHWAAEWVFGDPTDDDCDGLSLIWRTHQFAIPAKLPAARTVVHLVLTGAGGAQGWLDIQRPGHHRLQGRPRPGRRSRPRSRHRTDAALAHRPRAVPRPPRQRSRPLPRTEPPGRAFPTWFDTALYTEALRRADVTAVTRRRPRLNADRDALPDGARRPASSSAAVGRRSRPVTPARPCRRRAGGGGRRGGAVESAPARLPHHDLVVAHLLQLSGEQCAAVEREVGVGQELRCDLRAG